MRTRVGQVTARRRLLRDGALALGALAVACGFVALLAMLAAEVERVIGADFARPVAAEVAASAAED